MAIDTLGANALASDSVTTAKIVDDAVTSAKIPAGAVVVGDIADGSISTAKLADDAVTSAKVADDAITGAMLANDIAISTTGNIATTSSGTITSAGLITASGSVAIGGTGTANTLDDYEEGTWTPTAADATSGGNTTTTGQGRYTKIGRMVFINADLTNINTTGMTSSNTFAIQGLPFANNSTTRATCTLQCNRISNGDDLFAHLAENGSALTFKHNASGGTSTASGLNVSDVDDDQADMFGISLVYSIS